MKAEELRIGNYVWEDYGGQYLVRGVSETKVRISKTKTTIDVHYKITEIQPILLTEEWLLKFGMEKASDELHFFTKYYGQCLVFDDDDWCLKSRIDEPYVICYLRYVHQLQNLYFSLTGEELTLSN